MLLSLRAQSPDQRALSTLPRLSQNDTAAMIAPLALTLETVGAAGQSAMDLAILGNDRYDRIMAAFADYRAAIAADADECQLSGSRTNARPPPDGRRSRSFQASRQTKVPSPTRPSWMSPLSGSVVPKPGTVFCRPRRACNARCWR